MKVLNRIPIPTINSRARPIGLISIRIIDCFYRETFNYLSSSFFSPVSMEVVYASVLRYLLDQPVNLNA